VTEPTTESTAERGPIASATAGLMDWLARTADAPVRTAAPQAPEDGGGDGGEDGSGDEGRAGLSVWPMALLPERDMRNTSQREPLRFRVRHLVTGEVGALDRVLVAAVEAGDVTISLDPPSDQAWLALGVPPQPALVIDIPARVTRPTPKVPLVRGPLRVRGVPPVHVRGRVMAPGDLPLAGLRVEVISTGAWTYTDGAGRFAFAAVPEESPVRLALLGKGRRLVAQIASDQDLNDLVIQFDLEEA